MVSNLKRKASDCDDVKRVMVVEDYDDIRHSMEIILAATNYEVVVCANGSDAIIQYLKTFRCSSNAGLLCDLGLPDINGLRVMSAIREIEKGSAYDCVPVRLGAITANLELVEGTDLFESLNITLRLRKPVDVHLLVEQVNAWLDGPVPELYMHKKRTFTKSGAEIPRMR